MYRHVCTAPDGTFHDCASNMHTGQPALLTIDGVPADVVESLISPRIASNGDVHVVVGSGVDSDRIWLVTSHGTITHLGPGFGLSCAYVVWTGNYFLAFVVLDENGRPRAERLLIDADGLVTARMPQAMPPGGTSTGFLGINVATREPIWDMREVTRFGTHPVIAAVSSGKWQVGQDALPGSNATLVWDSKKLSIVSEVYTPIPPGLAAHGDQIRVAISNEPDVPILTEHHLRPYTAPVVQLPTIPGFVYPCYVGFSWVPAGHHAPGTVQVLTMMAGEVAQDWRQMADPSRPVFAGGADIALARPPKLLGQIGTIEGAGPDFDYAHAEDFHAFLRECADNETRPVFADDGEHGLFPQGILDHLPAWSLPCPECYPIHGESPSQTMARLDAKVFDLIDRWPYDLAVVVPTYTQQGKWGKASVLAIATRVRAWSDAAHGRLKLVWVFPRERGGVGGPLDDPDMMALGERYVSAVGAVGAPELRPVGWSVPPSPAKPHPPIPAPAPEPDATIGGTMQLPAGTYHVRISGDTLSMERVGDAPVPSNGSAPSYTTLLKAVEEVRAYRAQEGKGGEGQHDVIDAYRLLFEENMNVAAVKARA